MKRYIRGALGGLLAVLAAFGWSLTVLFAVSMLREDVMVGVHITRGWRSFSFLIPVSLIFSVGFYLAFRAAYSRKTE